MNDAIKMAEAVEAPLALDPFGSHPSWASGIAGLGGTEPAGAPDYAFMTLFCRPALGRVRARIVLHELAAQHGTLHLEIHVKSAFPGAEAWCLQSVAIDLAQLVAKGGVHEIEFASFRNSLYAVFGRIDGHADATASHLSISIDRRASADEHGKPWGWRLRGHAPKPAEMVAGLPLIRRQLADQGVPSLEEPVSQVGMPSQCQQPAFSTIADALDLPRRATPDAWAMAYVLRVIQAYAGGRSAKRMLAYPASAGIPLISHFAGQGWEILGLGHRPLHAERRDPGAELQELRVPALCDEADFFSHVHFTFGDIRLPPSSMHDQFDVIWSIGANRLMSKREFSNFVVNGLICARPGGLAVHVFDYIDDVDSGEDAMLTRHDIERMVVMALSHHNEVAPLRFNAGKDSGTGKASAVPFGVIVRRGQ